MSKEFKLPELGENITSATISRILVAVGEPVKLNQSVLEIETDKAVAEIPSTVQGMVMEIRVKEGQKVTPGQIIFVLNETAAAPAAPSPAPERAPDPGPRTTQAAVPAPAPSAAISTSAATSAAPGGPVLASPSIRRMAREMGIDLSTIQPSDPSGRITAQDLQPKTPAPEAAPPVPAPDSASRAMETGTNSWGAYLVEPMNAIRRKTAEHMTESWRIPQVTHFDKADITDLEATRLKLSKKAESAGARLNAICFIIKAVSEALKRFPKFNASVDMDNARILIKQYYHIGIAVDTPNGLLVPVIRDVDKKSILDIARELPLLAEKARARKLSLEDMQGGTFTISNLGGLGGTGFTPIVNHPEVAILGVSRSSVEPVYVEGTLQPRTILPLSLTYDHRIIDGADAARFMRWLAESLENPWRIFIGNL